MTWFTGGGDLVVPPENRPAAMAAVRAALANHQTLTAPGTVDTWRSGDGTPAVPDDADITDVLTHAGFLVSATQPAESALISVQYAGRAGCVTEVLDLLAPYVTEGEITWDTDEGTHYKDRFADGARTEHEGHVTYADEHPGWVIVEHGETVAVHTDVPGTPTLVIDWKRAVDEPAYARDVRISAILAAAPKALRDSMHARLNVFARDTQAGRR